MKHVRGDISVNNEIQMRKVASIFLGIGFVSMFISSIIHSFDLFHVVMLIVFFVLEIIFFVNCHMANKNNKKKNDKTFSSDDD